MAVLRVRTSFAANNRVYPAGSTVDAADPIVKGREDLFETVPAASEPVVEQTTAAPGEKRASTRRTAKKD